MRTLHYLKLVYSNNKKIADNLAKTFVLEPFKMAENQIECRSCPPGVMVKAMDSEIVVSEFELQSRYYVHFRTNTLGKVILSPMG